MQINQKEYIKKRLDKKYKDGHNQNASYMIILLKNIKKL